MCKLTTALIKLFEKNVLLDNFLRVHPPPRPSSRLYPLSKLPPNPLLAGDHGGGVLGRGAQETQVQPLRLRDHLAEELVVGEHGHAAVEAVVVDALTAHGQLREEQTDRPGDHQLIG